MQILTNSKMCAIGKRPICQDTGIVVVFLKYGIDVKWNKNNVDINKLIPELNSVRELTDTPSTKGVLTLAIFASIRAITAKLTRILRSFRLLGHKKGNNN